MIFTTNKNNRILVKAESFTVNLFDLTKELSAIPLRSLTPLRVPTLKEDLLMAQCPLLCEVRFIQISEPKVLMTIGEKKYTECTQFMLLNHLELEKNIDIKSTSEKDLVSSENYFRVNSYNRYNEHQSYSQSRIINALNLYLKLLARVKIYPTETEVSKKFWDGF